MKISVSEAKGQLTELVRRAEAGDEVILTRHGHPAVRLVLSGHAHLSRVDHFGGRVHVSSPALDSYPLAYRLVEVRVAGDLWSCSWETQEPADAATRSRALAKLQDNEIAHSYDPADPGHFARVSEGRLADRRGSAELRLDPA